MPLTVQYIPTRRFHTYQLFLKIRKMFIFTCAPWSPRERLLCPRWSIPRTLSCRTLAELRRRKKETSAKQFLHKASEKLHQAGIASERIKTSIQVSGYNIAGTIQSTASKDLADSILVGRQGLNAISEILLGSVSATLFQKCHNTPLWIIDGKVESKGFLVPVDGSPNSLTALDHLSHILSNRRDIHIYLFHCSSLFSQKPQCDLTSFHHNWDKEWCQKYLSDGDCLFNGPRQLLLEAGIPESHIHILPETPGIEKSQGIIREAKKTGLRNNCYGTKGCWYG